MVDGKIAREVSDRQVIQHVSTDGSRMTEAGLERLAGVGE
jgi:hypothetical protein